jgi:hypothetical protein
MTRSVEKGGVLRQTRADDAPWQLQPICRANTLVSWRVKPNYPSNCLHCHHVFRLEHGVGHGSVELFRRNTQRFLIPVVRSWTYLYLILETLFLHSFELVIQIAIHHLF